MGVPSLPIDRRDAIVDELVRPLKGAANADARADFATYAEKAWQLVARMCAGHDVPEPIVDEAVIAVAIELQTRRKSPSGIYAAMGEDTSPAYLARDPRSTAFGILRPFLPGGFA